MERGLFFKPTPCKRFTGTGDGVVIIVQIFAPGRDPRAFFTGIFPVNAMPTRYGTDIGRRILFSNAASYLDNFKQRYGDLYECNLILMLSRTHFYDIQSDNGGQMLSGYNKVRC